MKKIIAIVVSVVMLVALVACGGVSIENTSWTLESAVEVGSGTEEMFDSGSISFTNARFTMIMDGESVSGVYEISENGVVYLTVDGVTIAGAVEGNRFIIEDAGMRVTFVKD